jgi:PAS domain S-box-containing protein
MTDQYNTVPQLIAELVELRRGAADLEALVTAQNQLLEMLQINQSNVTAILDIANEAIISINENQQIILFNKGGERMFGYSAEEVIGQPLGLLLPRRSIMAHQDHIAAFARSGVTTRLMGERQEIYGRRKNGQEFPAEASISRVEQDGKQVFTAILRDITERKQIEQEREKLIIELRALNEGTLAITAELSVEQVLQKIAQTTQRLVKAKYAALGLHDGQGGLARFITVGIEPADQAKIGPLPAGRGLLGYLLHQGRSIIVNNISENPVAVGFPEGHPIMEHLLGVPIFAKGELIGALYLADKQDGTDFSQTDLQLVEMLALHAAIAIENARLYEQTQRLAVLEERERFARDLHDGIIQSIYAVGLALDQAKLDIRPPNEAAKTQIEVSLKSLARVVQDIRNYIFDLRPQALKYQGLRARLEGLIKELRVNTLLPIQAKIDEDIDTYLSDTQASHIFHICHEALANTARHARASQIYLHLTRVNNLIELQIEDNGIGFEYDPQVAPGHRGLTNIQSRATQIDARLKIDTAPQQGTRLTLVLHCNRT